MVEKSIVQARISGPVAFQYFDRKKVGFSVPLALWLRTELKPLLCDVLSKDGLTAVGYLEHGEVEKLVSEHLSGSANHESKLWALINLVLWERQRRVSQSQGYHRSALGQSRRGG